MNQVGIAEAARNNAAWCDAVCNAHGRPGEFFDGYWLTRRAAPPFYPNLVTLDPAVEPALAALRGLAQAGLPACWGVKDSFGVLRLDQVGFQLLFEAQWIVRPPQAAPRLSRILRWQRVRTEAKLAAWEEVWGESRGQARILLPPLLRDADIAILAGLDAGGAVTAGVIANRSTHVVGVSNLFVRGRDGDAVHAECIATVVDTFPHLPLVGYESGPALVMSRSLGFKPLGRLRVWVKEA